MQFDVPFLPDPKFVQFLCGVAPRLESVHFSLGSALMADARNPLELLEPGEPDELMDELIGGLASLPVESRYVLANARMQEPERYFDPAHLIQVCEVLERLKDEAGLTGMIFSDGYYLNALAKTAPSLCAGLEGVPSVNCMIDSARRARTWLRLVESSGFAMPSRLVLDRGLNRDLSGLEDTVTELRNAFPGLRILLLANEGCLPQCPYKPAHDAHLGVARFTGCADRTHRMNRDFGCLADLAQEPWRLFTSPFIRPEDLGRYEGLVDGFKLCGRERGGRAYLERTVGAYVEGRFAGNLLSIMDTLGAFEDVWEVANQDLPEDFHDRVRDCELDCTSCGHCEALAGLVRRKDPAMTDLRPRQE